REPVLTAADGGEVTADRRFVQLVLGMREQVGASNVQDTREQELGIDARAFADRPQFLDRSFECGVDSHGAVPEDGFICDLREMAARHAATRSYYVVIPRQSRILVRIVAVPPGSRPVP